MATVDITDGGKYAMTIQNNESGMKVATDMNGKFQKIQDYLQTQATSNEEIGSQVDTLSSQVSTANQQITQMGRDIDSIESQIATGTSNAKASCRFVIGTLTAGWKASDVNYLCNGSNDTSKIQEAINALPSSGGEIIFLDGVYKITSTININLKNGQCILLNGNGGSSKLEFNTSSGYGIKISSSYQSSIDINSLCFTSTESSLSNYSQDIFDINTTNGVGISIHDCYFCYLDTCISTTDDAIFDDTYALAYCLVDNNFFYNCESPIDIEYTDRIVVSNNIVVSHNLERPGSGIHAHVGYVTCVLSNNLVYGNYSNGIDIDHYTICTNNIIYGFDKYGINMQGASECTVTGNLILKGGSYSSTSYPIYITNADNGIIAFNNMPGKALYQSNSSGAYIENNVH